MLIDVHKHLEQNTGFVLKRKVPQGKEKRFSETNTVYTSVAL